MVSNLVLLWTVTLEYLQLRIAKKKALIVKSAIAAYSSLCCSFAYFGR
jgi:hypothetical protein